MKRRNFLAALFALPFAAKPLEALAQFDERRALFSRLFDHKKAIDANTESVRALSEALRLNAPTGWKIDHTRYKQRRYSAEDLRAFGKALRHYKKLLEKK